MGLQQVLLAAGLELEAGVVTHAVEQAVAWRITAIDAPHTLEFDNGFANQDGTVDETMPVMVMRVSLSEK